MRLFEVARPQLPSTHPVLAVLEIDRDVWQHFRQLAQAVEGVRIAAHCPTARGRVTVYVGCGDDRMRQVLETTWPPAGAAS